MLEGGEERRVLTSEVYARKHSNEMGTPARGAVVVVDDEKRWKQAQETYPVRHRFVSAVAD